MIYILRGKTKTFEVGQEVNVQVKPGQWLSAKVMFTNILIVRVQLSTQDYMEISMTARHVGKGKLAFNDIRSKY